MPTAASLNFSLDWIHLVGVFNSFIALVTQPVALVVGLILAVIAVGFVVSAVKPQPEKRRLKQSRHIAASRVPPAKKGNDLVTPAKLAANGRNTKTRHPAAPRPRFPINYNPDLAAAQPQRRPPAYVIAVIEWFRDITAWFRYITKRRPNPNLIRPDYTPEIEPPPAKEYVPPLDTLTSALDQSLEQLAAPDPLPEPQAVIEELIAESPAINQRLADEQPEPRHGQIVRVFGADPTRQYDLQYEVRELDELITSNTDAGSVNPAYPAELQPRDRTRTASALQVGHIAQALEPDALLSEFLALDRGAPIIGDDNAVESGNGRVLALRRAAADYPTNYVAYRQRLAEVAEERGIDPADLSTYRRPVLVRRRLTEVDRVEFAHEANTAAVLGMSDTERARSDAQRISAAAIGQLEIGDDTDRALNSPRNRDFIRSFVAQLPENERAAIIDSEGDLNQSGVRRIKAALFNRVYDSPALSNRIFESTDNDIKNVTNGLMGSLGRLAQAEEKVRQGQRDPDLALAGDIAASVEKFATLKEEGTDVSTYLAQGQLFGRELSPTQERILEALDERRRSGKQVQELVNSWADVVDTQPDPRQGALFGDPAPKKEELVERWLKQPAPQLALF